MILIFFSFVFVVLVVLFFLAHYVNIDWRQQTDNRMICNGRQIELDSFDLQLKSNMISKCVLISEMLAKANLSDNNLDSDPIFVQDGGKVILVFLNKKGSLS